MPPWTGLRQEEVAIKVLLPHLLADPKARERFLTEARIASPLRTRNISASLTSIRQPASRS